MYKIDSVAFISVWLLDGAEILRDLDLSLTYGDGDVLYAAAVVRDEVARHQGGETGVEGLLAELDRLIRDFGPIFPLMF